MRLSGFWVLFNLLLCISINNSFAADPDSIISQMLDSGYNQRQADSLLANRSTAKHSMVKYAKVNQGNKAKLDVLEKICQNRFDAREHAVMGAVKDAMAAGYSKPIDALVPTGGWKKAMAIDPNKNAQRALGKKLPKTKAGY